jgi:hypothetical protein
VTKENAASRSCFPLERRRPDKSNMPRIYRSPADLAFDGVYLIKERGRIGSRGRIMAEHQEFETLTLLCDDLD